MLAAAIARRAKRLGQRYERDEEDREDSPYAHDWLDARLAAARTWHRETPDSARSFAHPE
jgi:hypothetical protein